ncbi:reverse transcriptase domain-containing protein [Tanacetum coccineum]
MCHASDYAVRAVLGKSKDKHFQPIHYASKMMNEAHENYTTMEKELLAVVFAFDKFRQYQLSFSRIIQPCDIISPNRMQSHDCNAQTKSYDDVKSEAAQILRQCHSGSSGGHDGIATTARKVFEAGFYWPNIFCDPLKLV